MKGCHECKYKELAPPNTFVNQGDKKIYLCRYGLEGEPFSFGGRGLIGHAVETKTFDPRCAKRKEFEMREKLKQL